MAEDDVVNNRMDRHMNMVFFTECDLSWYSFYFFETDVVIKNEYFVITLISKVIII